MKIGISIEEAVSNAKRLAEVLREKQVGNMNEKQSLYIDAMIKAFKDAKPEWDNTIRLSVELRDEIVMMLEEISLNES